MATLEFQAPAHTPENEIVPIIFETICNYLRDPTMESQVAATRATELLAPSLQRADGSTAVKDLWGTLFWVVKQIPPSHDYQARLVQLLLSIREISSPLGEASASGERYWHGLPYIRNAWSLYERAAPLVPRMGERLANHQVAIPSPGPWSTQLAGREWTSVQAFSARLHTSSDLPFLDLRGMFALLEALEREHDADALDNLVPAAACWIRYTGTKLKNNNVPYPSYDFDDNVKRSPWSVGELYTGPKCFNTERWEFWRSRFREIGNRDDLSTETKTWAREAARQMDEE